jgi:hypothetical protein
MKTTPHKQLLLIASLCAWGCAQSSPDSSTTSIFATHHSIDTTNTAKNEATIPPDPVPPQIHQTSSFDDERIYSFAGGNLVLSEGAKQWGNQALERLECTLSVAGPDFDDRKPTTCVGLVTIHPGYRQKPHTRRFCVSSGGGEPSQDVDGIIRVGFSEDHETAHVLEATPPMGWVLRTHGRTAMVWGSIVGAFVCVGASIFMDYDRARTLWLMAGLSGLAFVIFTSLDMAIPMPNPFHYQRWVG